jgi:hypothetical protein
MRKTQYFDLMLLSVSIRSQISNDSVYDGPFYKLLCKLIWMTLCERFRSRQCAIELFPGIDIISQH